MRHSSGVSDLWMKYQPVASVLQRFGVRGNYRHAGLLVQPRMRGSNACLQSETIDCYGTLSGRHGEIDQQRCAPLSTKDFIKPHDTALAWHQLVTGLLTQLLENWVEQRILELLGDDCAFQIKKTTRQTQPFKIAVV